MIVPVSLQGARASVVRRFRSTSNKASLVSSSITVSTVAWLIRGGFPETVGADVVLLGQ